MKIKFIIFFSLLFLEAFSQGEASNWFFGDKAGIKFNMDNTITVLSTEPSPVGLRTNEGCSSYSTSTGDLLLYTDGRTVWDKNHVIMPNGDYDAGTGLMGDPSSTQSGIIVPKPNNRNVYYIFTVDEPHDINADSYPNQFTGIYGEVGFIREQYPKDDDGYNNGLNYSTVDITLIGSNGSVGDVTMRNKHLVTYNPNNREIRYKCSEKITAVKSKNGDAYWVITHFVNKFYAFKVDENGVNETPVITITSSPIVPISGYRRNAIGYMKASPDGKKIAIAHNQLGTEKGGTSNNGVIYLYDFNDETGVLTNQILLDKDITPYGIEFSAETKKLYATTNTATLQFNLEVDDIPLSKRIISNRGNAALQLAPNRKIYKANISIDEKYLDVINNPELDGDAANFEARAVDLKAGLSKFGLPPFITSVFESSIIADRNCVGSPTTFSLNVNGTIDSAQWNFGDGSPVSNGATTSHIFTASGSYTVTANIIVQGVPVIAYKTIEVNIPPTATPSTLTQCSPDGNDTGILFDLSQANDEITGGDATLETSFYISKTHADDDTSPLPTQYENISNGQELFVRVTDKTTNCFSVTTLNLTVNISATNTYKIENCDIDGTQDGIYRFNLTEANIATDFPAPAVISYFADVRSALLEENPVGDHFTNTIANNQTIYARIEIDNKCQGIYPIKLIVKELPRIGDNITKYVCINLPLQHITLDSGLLLENPTDFQYLWSTGEISSTISTNTPGVYTVKVTNNLGCEKTRTITVSPSNNPTIENVIVNDLTINNTIEIILTTGSIGDYLYSINGPDGPFQRSNYFENVAAGLHNIYVYDARNCGFTTQIATVMTAPKFFSPNADGYHDTWRILGMNAVNQAKTKIYIYDRLGKLLSDIDPKGIGWNGIYNGRPLPATDYWYVIILESGRVAKGHFSLVR